MSKLEIENVQIETLTFDPSNARKHDDKNIEAIAGSLKLFGQRKPIVVTPDNVVVAGNGTLQAAKNLGWTEIAIARTPRGWTWEQIKAFALADNRTAELAEWDSAVLADQLLELDAVGWDLAEFGFEPLEPPISPDDDDEPLSFDDAPTRAKLGDIWQLGNHRLMCGDSTDLNTVSKLLNGNKIDLVFTDPPYRQDTSGAKNDVIGKAINKTSDEIANMIDFEPEQFLTVLPTVFEKGIMNAYIFCNKNLVPDYLNWAISNNYSFNILFWKKPNALPLASSHRPDVEYLIFIRKNAIWNNSLPNVNYSKCLEFGRDNSTSHPTMKPIELITNEIQISSNQNSNILDLYGGSGSTLIASEKTKRNCFTIELDPKYCDVILKRWENLTGLEAQLIED